MDDSYTQLHDVFPPNLIAIYAGAISEVMGRFSFYDIDEIRDRLGISHDLELGRSTSTRGWTVVKWATENHKLRALYAVMRDLKPEIPDLGQAFQDYTKQAKEYLGRTIPKSNISLEVLNPLLTGNINVSLDEVTSISGVDFVLVTALPEELGAVLRMLPGIVRLAPSEEDIRTYYQVELPIAFSDGTSGFYKLIVLRLLGMGRVEAATATADAIRRWHPRYVVMIGIAGGVANRGVNIGDVLIADQVVDYESQKITPQGSEIRWEVFRVDARLLNACGNITAGSWQTNMSIASPDGSKPNLHVGTVVSGDKVITIKEKLEDYLKSWPKLIGVEMEAAGVAKAASQAPNPPGFFMVRGTSDLADINKGSADVEKWRLYACDAAAAYTLALLSSGPFKPRSSNRDSVPPVNLLHG